MNDKINKLSEVRREIQLLRLLEDELKNELISEFGECKLDNLWISKFNRKVVDTDKLKQHLKDNYDKFTKCKTVTRVVVR